MFGVARQTGYKEPEFASIRARFTTRSGSIAMGRSAGGDAASSSPPRSGARSSSCSPTPACATASSSVGSAWATSTRCIPIGSCQRLARGEAITCPCPRCPWLHTDRHAGSPTDPPVRFAPGGAVGDAEARSAVAPEGDAVGADGARVETSARRGPGPTHSSKLSGWGWWVGSARPSGRRWTGQPWCRAGLASSGPNHDAATGSTAGAQHFARPT